MHSFLEINKDSDFPLQNLPFGIFHHAENPKPRMGVALGNQVIDLCELARHDLLPGVPLQVLESASLNPFMALGPSVWHEVRITLIRLFDKENPTLKDDQNVLSKVLVSGDLVTMHMPVEIGDYTDFYSSYDHAKNIGTFFRDKNSPLLPNWLHLPVAYHGRASSVVLSGTPIYRPCGQIKPKPDEPPIFAPTRKLDIELEMGVFVGTGNPLGQPIPIRDAFDHVFGFVLVNDWSARDIQYWEYQPLGPFLAKNFATSISPWVVTCEALEPFKIPLGEMIEPPLPYLTQPDRFTYDINLSVHLKPAGTEAYHVISESNFKHVYWSVAQQIAHHTITGCNLKTGDLLASGTISGPTPNSFGSLIELTQNGTKPLQLGEKITRVYLEDGDEVSIKASCHKSFKIGFGEVRGRIYPAK